MVPSGKVGRSFLFLAYLALFFGQVSGAHLHLCFDGQEPPVTVHTGEDGATYIARSALHGTLLDEEVNLFGDIVSKKSQCASDMLALLVAIVFVSGGLRFSASAALRGRDTP